MAKLKKDGNRWVVVHGRTGAPLKRKGRIVAFVKESEGLKEVRRLHRGMGK